MLINYTDDLISNISDKGMNDELWNLANDDLKKLKGFNIKSDKERNLLFYLESFINDLLKEFGVDIDDVNNIIKYTFERLRSKDNVDLTDIRKAVFVALKKCKKTAYPNIQGVCENNIKPERDISKWVKTLSEIYYEINKGKNKNIVVDNITEDWSPMEKIDFSAWMRYYENDDHEKYGLKVKASPYQIPNQVPNQIPNQVLVQDKEDIIRGPGRPRKVTKTLEETKQSLISRLDSASRLLREFSSVWPPNIWGRLSEALSDLKREIIPMKTISSMNDRIIRTAGLWNKYGFYEGAELLEKIAQADDVTTQIEKALTGKEYDMKSTPEMLDIPPAEEMPPMSTEPIEGDENIIAPPAGVEEKMPSPEMPPLPPVEEKPKEKEMISVEEDPFKGMGIKDALAILEPLAQKLSEREFVHSLSKADMILDSLNIASHFPELAEAQNKALELNIYVLSRLKSIISKLKGGLKDGDSKDENLPTIEMGEVKSPKEKEIGEVKSPKEKEMFEVKEEKPFGK